MKKDNNENVKKNYIKLNYDLETAEERVELVKEIVNNAEEGQLTPKYLEILSNYIIFAMNKEEKRKKEILTDNRLITIKRREVSFEGVSEKMKNGEDGIYGLMSNLGKYTLLTHKNPITEEDYEVIPGLKELKEEIEGIKELYEGAKGKRKYLLKKQLIEMYQDLYVIRNEYRGGGNRINYNHVNATANESARIVFEDYFSFDENGFPVNSGLISFFNPHHIEAILCNYSDLKAAAYGNFNCDLWYLMDSFDDLAENALKEKYPLYFDLMVYKIDGRSNLEIQALLARDYKIKHTVEYISSLWRKKIPRLIADRAETEYLIWYYQTYYPKKWKKCSRCGEWKPAHNKFFSKNGSSKDGFYSLCKDCRNAKSQKNKELKKIRERKGKGNGS